LWSVLREAMVQELPNGYFKMDHNLLQLESQYLKIVRFNHSQTNMTFRISL
jgi:hypothetical protein